MSYRTYVEGTQVFGNNEYYPEWIEFIKEQGIEVNDECIYEGEIKDFMKALQIIEKIVLRLEKEKRERNEKLEKEMEEKNFSKEEKEFARTKIYGIKSIFDWKNIFDKVINNNDKYGFSLLDELISIIDESYAFLPYQFLKACEGKIERDRSFSTEQHFNCYKIKENESIYVRAS